MKHTTAFMLACFVLILSICFFIFGFQLSYYGNVIGLLILSISFFTGIISTYCVAKWKTKLNIIIEYGTPVWNSAEHIKTIITQANQYGVKSLQTLVKKTIEKELEKVIKNA